MSSGVIITPQAWIPVFRIQPSIFFAESKTANRSSFGFSKMDFISSTKSLSSSFNLSYFDKALAIFIPGTDGINFAILLVSGIETSNTLPASFIADFPPKTE